MIGDILTAIGFVRGLLDERLKLDAAVRTICCVNGVWHYKLWVLNSGREPYTLKFAQFVDANGGELGRVYFRRTRLETRDATEERIHVNLQRQDTLTAIKAIVVQTECGTRFEVDFDHTGRQYGKARDRSSS